MSFDTRNNSALMKRAEQLKRWEESETNREPTVPKNEKGRKIKFPSGCVFLAACIAADKDEVIRLLENGADINTANVDGLTGLHQVCIDDNLEMVEFLIEHGADINRQDNEGWTPLHATASCGSVSIARYLVENGADITAINSDGELAIDLAPRDSPMEEYLQSIIEERGIDCDEARQIEERIMLEDAKKWLRSDAAEVDRPHPRTGATALHVAAAKGYKRVLSLLLAGRANVDKQDNDGWTPLHAAAHWAQKEAGQMLVAAMADMDVKNYAGQTCIDVADLTVVKFFEELKANNKRSKRRPASQIRITDTIENHIETPPKVIRVEVKNETKDVIKEDALNSLDRISESEETDSDVTDSTESSHSTSISESLDEKTKPPEPPAPTPQENNTGEEETPWRRSGSVRTRLQQESPPKIQVPDKVQSSESEVILRRAQSFENDEKFYQKYNELRARIKANSCPILPATQQTGVLSGVNPPNNFSVQRSASLKDHRYLRKAVSPPVSPSTPATTPNTGQVRSNHQNNNAVGNDSANHSNNNHNNNNNNNNIQKPVERKNDTKNDNSGSLRSKMSPGTIFKNFFKSFVPPVRDEESETQRKAHAKRVRETRRSTQGVTLDEIKSAEELVKKKNLNNNNNNNETPNTPSSSTTIPTTSITTTTTTATPTINLLVNDRVPSTTPTDDEKTTSSKGKTSDQVTTSYTILSNKSTDRNSSTDDKISASYTISPPTTGNKPSILSSETNNKNDLANISATANVPISSNKKTDDLEELTKTASPTIFKTDSNTDSHHANRKSDLTEPNRTMTGIAESNRIRDKRSLFDIDNANSLTLAEKLRNEANKYNEASRSNNDITSVGTNKSNQEDQDKEKEKDSNLSRRCDSTPSSPLHHVAAERRPSWRMKFDAGSKFKLEDASAGTTYPSNNSTIITSAPAVIAAANMSSIAQRRHNNTSTTAVQTQRPVSAPVISTGTSNADSANERVKDNNVSEVTVTLRRNKSDEDKENDKENDSRSGQATQAAIQRRRRPKRRSTGVVHVDMDDIDPDRQDSPGDNDEKESGSERTSRSRLGSTSSLAASDKGDSKTGNSSANGDVIDYKALWEAAKVENEKLKELLKKKDDEIQSAKAAVERFTNATSKNSLSELEKRERRAMERKLSEMEEELKQLETLKADNQRLKEENGALIRVISKLSK